MKTDYEKLRERKIARNNAHLASLGLANASENMRKKVEADRARKKRKQSQPKVKQEPTRR
jgi:hypothetical protein